MISKKIVILLLACFENQEEIENKVRCKMGSHQETEKLNEIYMPFGVKERNGGTGLPRKEGSLLVNKKSKYLISRCLPCCIDGITLGK